MKREKETIPPEILVNIEGSGPYALIISSYDTVTWKINAGSSELKAIMVEGFRPQKVLVRPSIPVIVSSPVNDGPCVQHFTIREKDLEFRNGNYKLAREKSLILFGKEPAHYKSLHSIRKSVTLP